MHRQGHRPAPWHLHGGSLPSPASDASRRACSHIRATPMTSPVNPVTTLQASGLTVSDLATAKRLQPERLRNWGVSDTTRRGIRLVRIPYRDFEGRELAVRFRHALAGDRRFSWRSGDHVHLYGLDRLTSIKELGWVLLRS